MVLLSRLLLIGISSKMSTSWANQIHVKCRGEVYPRSDIKRLVVPEDKVKWAEPWPEYNPPVYTSPSLKGQPWADNEISEQFSPKFNHKLAFNEVNRDDYVAKNRISYTGEYQVINGFPINPIGRTGLRGRGLLGKWGPNHAADFILTRWLRNEMNGQQIMNEDSQKPILQFLAIERLRANEWAIPGGMVDAGEEPDHAAQREFLEEAMNSDNLEKKDLENITQMVAKIFSRAKKIYQGYVDDPRNTDNAWMETTAFNCHADGTEVDKWPFHAGSDAKRVAWLEIAPSLNLYASHVKLIEIVAKHHDAHW